MHPRSSLYSSTGRYGTPQEKRGKVSKEARQLKETLMEYLENTVFEHQGELNVIYDRLDRMEEENRYLRSESSYLRRENRELARVKEELHGVYSELDALKRHLGLLPPLPTPYRRALDPRGAPFSLWRQDRTRAKFRPAPIRTDKAQEHAAVNVGIQLEGDRKYRPRTKESRQSTAERQVTEIAPREKVIDTRVTETTQPDQSLVPRLKRGRDDTRFSPTSPQPPVKRRRSISKDVSAHPLEGHMRDSGEHTVEYIDLCSSPDRDHEPGHSSLILVPSHALPCS